MAKTKKRTSNRGRPKGQRATEIPVQVTNRALCRFLGLSERTFGDVRSRYPDAFPADGDFKATLAGLYQVGYFAKVFGVAGDGKEEVNKALEDALHKREAREILEIRKKRMLGETIARSEHESAIRELAGAALSLISRFKDAVNSRLRDPKVASILDDCEHQAREELAR